MGPGGRPRIGNVHQNQAMVMKRKEEAGFESLELSQLSLLPANRSCLLGISPWRLLRSSDEELQHHLYIQHLSNECLSLCLS